MGLAAVLDYIANRASTEVTGLKGAYSPAADSATARAMPRSVDDWPIATFLPGSSDAQAGNGEMELHDIVARVWVNATNIDFAFKTIVPFPERFKAMCRTNQDQGGAVTRLLYMGYDDWQVDEAHGKPFLTIDIRLQALEYRLVQDNTA